MKINILNKQKKVNLDIRLLKKIASYAADKFDKNKNTQINIIFVSGKKIKELNACYRQVQNPTDVLSFSYLNTSLHPKGNKLKIDDEIKKNYDGVMEIGEIIISPEIAKENVESDTGINIYKINNGNSDLSGDERITREIVLLIIHGILHLYGYDHERKKQRIEMENIQKNLMNDIFCSFFK